jgi:nitroreductase
MDAYRAIVTKRDTRSYKPDPVPDELLTRALNAARMAGSAKNSQVTRLVVATDSDLKEQLAACGDFTAWIPSAPVVIVFVIPTDTGRLFDVGRMAQNLMIAGHADGLASCPVTFHHQDRMRDAIGLPQTHEGPMGVTLGFPAPVDEATRMRGARISLDELVRYNRFT